MANDELHLVQQDRSYVSLQPGRTNRMLEEVDQLLCPWRSPDELREDDIRAMQRWSNLHPADGPCPSRSILGMHAHIHRQPGCVLQNFRGTL